MTGATGYLECTAVGVPAPNVTLTTDVDFVSDNRFTITSAVAGNAGNYTCNASNFLGFEEQTIELLVGGKLYTLTAFKHTLSTSHLHLCKDSCTNRLYIREASTCGMGKASHLNAFRTRGSSSHLPSHSTKAIEA